jgi:hypothetical protein
VKTCDDRPPNKDSIACILKAKHREPEHSDGKVTWVYYCDVCDAVIRAPGRCKRCGGTQHDDVY